jgi:hypothetical protein
VTKAEDYARRLEIFHQNGIQVNGSFVLGFDHDRPEVFDDLASWIEEERLENATFHILTPYPNTPLFRRMEAEGRLLHKDWSFYDTAHCVFRPKHMSPEEFEAGYANLPASVQPEVNLGMAAETGFRRPAVPGNVDSVQALQLALEAAHPISIDPRHLEPARALDALAPPKDLHHRSTPSSVDNANAALAPLESRRFVPCATSARAGSCLPSGKDKDGHSAPAHRWEIDLSTHSSERDWSTTS